MVYSVENIDQASEKTRLAIISCTAKLLRNSDNLAYITLRTFGNTCEEGDMILQALKTASSTKIKSLLLGTNHEWWSKDGQWGINEAASTNLAPLLAR